MDASHHYERHYHYGRGIYCFKTALKLCDQEGKTLRPLPTAHHVLLFIPSLATLAFPHHLYFCSCSPSLHPPLPDLALYPYPSLCSYSFSLSLLPLWFPILIHSPCIPHFFYPSVTSFLLLFFIPLSLYFWSCTPCLTALSYLSCSTLLFHSSSSHHSLLLSHRTVLLALILSLPALPTHLFPLSLSIPFSLHPSHLLSLALYPLLPPALTLALSLFAISLLFHPLSLLALVNHLSYFPVFPPPLLFCHGGHIFNYSVQISPTGHFQLDI